MLPRVHCFIDTTAHFPEKVENPSINACIFRYTLEKAQMVAGNTVTKQKKNESLETIQLFFSPIYFQI